jgi:hypothetical protein
MTRTKFNQIVEYIVSNCIRLKDKYVKEKNLDIDYICIFSQDGQEFKELVKNASSIGEKIQETKTGPVYKINREIKTRARTPKLLKIRLPDKTRPQRGDVDFITDYVQFKSDYLDNKRFKLIERQEFEMIELRDNKFNVLVYFSSIPPSKLLGIRRNI